MSKKQQCHVFQKAKNKPLIDGVRINLTLFPRVHVVITIAYRNVADVFLKTLKSIILKTFGVPSL